MPAPDVPEVRLATRADVPGILRLYERAFDRWPVAARVEDRRAHLEWKSFALGPPAGVVCLAGDEVIGADLPMIQPLWVQGRHFSASQAADVAVDPEWQGRGVLSRMRALRAEVFDSVFDVRLGHTANAAVAHVQNREGAVETAAAVLWWTMPLSPGAVVRAPSMPPSARMRLAWRALSRRTGERDGIAMRPAAGAFDNRFDELWQLTSSHVDFAIPRSRAYLAWRYGDRRAGRYQLLTVEDGGRLAAYAVIAAGRDGVGRIADLQALPGSEARAAPVLDLALRWLRANGCRAARAVFSEADPVAAVLRKAGFRARDRFPLTYRTLRAPVDALDVLKEPKARIRFTLGDTDLA